MEYTSKHEVDVREILLGHLKKQIGKYSGETGDFRKDFHADVSSCVFGKNFLMVCSIVVSQLLRNGIEGMDQQGYVAWETLVRAFSAEIMAVKDAMVPEIGFDVIVRDSFFAPLLSVLDNDRARDTVLRHIIFEERDPGDYENCGRGGRYGSMHDVNGTLLVRARYGHTISSGLDLETVAGTDTTLSDSDTLVHGTTWKNFMEIMETGGIYGGEGLAVMMEKMPEELTHFVDYVREGRDDEGKGGLKDPVSVARRHLPEDKRGTVVLVETKEVAALRTVGVRIYTANPPACMFQVVSGVVPGPKGLLGVPVEGLGRFHLFKVKGREREYAGTAESGEEAKKLEKTLNG